MTPSHKSHYKTRQQAITKILEMLVANPAVAGLDGNLQIIADGIAYLLKPIKRKNKEML